MEYYEIPKQFYFRLHHPRPRFKNDIENVLIYLAIEIAQIGKQKKNDFIKELNLAIRRFPGNLTKSEKTINNWRTEIDALFGFIKEENGFLGPSNRAEQLAKEQDLTKFFKLFSYFFQYPGGFLKAEKNKELIINKINFRPCTYILNMLNSVETSKGKRAGITKSEAAHCIFNDLRVTRDGRSVDETWDLILKNRKNKIGYDWGSDVIRYAGDILDYMAQANLLNRQLDGKYYINHNEDLAIQRFIKPEESFNFYSKFENNNSVPLSDLRSLEKKWFDYFNTSKEDSFFDTDVLALFSEDEKQYNRLKNTFTIFDAILDSDLDTSGKIGSVGESLALNHEKIKISSNGRQDLSHLIKLIPSVYSVGYDINSVEVDGTKRLIEVKTTASKTELSFNRFHLTPNEWSAAETFKERYFVYRILVTKGKIKLFIIQNPVGQYKKDFLQASPKDGMDISFDPNKCGFYEELLFEYK